MMRPIVELQPWQQVPAPQLRPTSATVSAPSRTTRLTVRSETPLQWQMSIERKVLGFVTLPRVEPMKLKINVNFKKIPSVGLAPKSDNS
jgi:hypothetical protein